MVAYLEGRLRRESGTDDHTGYVLEIEVDLSAVEDAGELDEEQVAVTGDVMFVDYPERGKVVLFRVTSAAAIDEAPE